MTAALAGFRVIDFGQYVAGPLAAMLLADEGAEVIRIDPPGGPRLRTPANATWQRGKQVRVLDLKTAAGRDAARALIATADVVVENFRPGCMDRLGVGPASSMAANPRLIYCSLPGFAADDPRAGLQAWEGVVAAATNTYRPGADGGEQPAYLGIPIASNFAAFLAAAAITAALAARLRDGVGQCVEVPLFEAMFAAIGARAMRVPVRTDPVLDHFGFGIYVCGDGRCVHFAPVTPRFMDWFAEAEGLGSWRDEGLLDRTRLNAEPALVAALRARLAILFKGRTAPEWEALGDRIGVPLAMCRTMAEWAETRHALQSGTIVTVDDPQLGPMRVPGRAIRNHPPLRSGGGVGKVDGGGQPQPPSIKPQPALAGLRVLDLTQVWAGPTAARLLAEFGADVIKINSPHEPVLTHVDVNRGKRTILLDLATPDGLDVFWRLVATADVVMQNFRHGVAERLGIGYDQVCARKPDILYASVSAYGYDGPWAARRGYEVQGQAVAGAQAQFGGDGPAQRMPYEINDYGTGVLAGYAVMLAHLHRLRTGEGQHAAAALAYTATLHQSLFLQSYAGKAWDEPRGQSALGTGPLQRLYRASDAWFFLGARPAELHAVEGLKGLAGLEGEALAAALAERFATAPAADWVRRIVAAGAGAHALVGIADLLADPWVQARGLVITRDNPGVGAVTTIGPVPRLSRTPVQPGRAVPPPGADQAEVLAELARGLLGGPSEATSGAEP